MSEQDKKPQTTGHVWDDDLQEYNNPLPNWWLWTFYASVIFAVVYWILYPAWPVADSYTSGISTITFKTETGEEKTTNWNTRALLIKEMQEGDAAMKQKAAFEKFGNMEHAELVKNPDAIAFVKSLGKQLFGDNCAACHGYDAQGVIGLFPSLQDDDWLFGGKVENIEYTLQNGRVGYMPYFDAKTITDEELDAIAEYVLSLSGTKGLNEKVVATGQMYFNGSVGGCYYCHTSEGTGLHSQGSANLTDAIWTIANVPAANSLQDKKDAIKTVIRKGVGTANGAQRIMPAWNERLKPEEIRILAVYVHELGGGQ